MEFTLGTSNDFHGCLRVAEQLSSLLTQDTRSQLEQDLADHHVYLARVEGEVVGFAIVQKRGNHVAQVNWMVVDPRFQNKGIGKSLLSRVMGDLILDGISLVEAKVVIQSDDPEMYERARHFYVNRGFILLDTIDSSELYVKTIAQNLIKQQNMELLTP